MAETKQLVKKTNGKPKKPGPRKGTPSPKKGKILIKNDGTVVTKERIDQFMEEFIRNGGNATRAALVVFNCKNIYSAQILGHTYVKQAQGLGRLIMEKKGYGYGKMLEVAIRKMEDSKTPEWFDRLMKIGDYQDFLTKEKSTPQVVNIVQGHKSMTSSYIDGEVEDGEVSED